MTRYVLDTSAVLSVLLGEPEGQAVIDILAQAEQGAALVLIPFLALMESEYQLLRRFQTERVESSLLLVEGWPTTIVESDEAWRREAARIKADGRLSLADAWMAALAMLHDAKLVHKDPEFDHVAGLQSVRL